MAKKVKQSLKQTEYNRYLSKVQKRYNTLIERGYTLPLLEDIIPSIEKRNSILRLKTFTIKKLASKGTYVSRETGKRMSGSKAYSQYLSESAKKGASTRKRKKEQRQALKDYRNEHIGFTQPTEQNTLSQPVGDMIKYILDYIDSMPSKIYNGANGAIIEHLKDQLGEIVQKNVDSFGYEKYNKYLTDNEEKIVNLCDIVDPYVKQGVQQAISHITELSTILNDGMLDFEISKLDSELSDTYGDEEVD